MPKASTFGERGHIPLPHPPPIGLLLLFFLTEHPLDENPGYAPAAFRFSNNMVPLLTSTELPSDFFSVKHRL